MMVAFGMEVLRKATNSAMDSAGWCSPIDAACVRGDKDSSDDNGHE